MSLKCLNCNSDTENNFCSVCGQKTSTHRFSLHYFLTHDLIHGVFHLDKGFLFTIKQLFVRPGHSIREYIQGKRVKHFNYLTSILILIAIGHFLGSFSKVSFADLYEKGQMTGYAKVVKEYAKVIILIGIPLFTLTSYLVFKRAKQNYTEHLVVNTYLMSGILVIGLLFPLITLFYSNIKVLQVINLGIPFLELVYYYWFFYQYFSVFGYQKSALVLRSVLVAILFLVIKGLINYGVDKIGYCYFN